MSNKESIINDPLNVELVKGEFEYLFKFKNWGR